MGIPTLPLYGAVSHGFFMLTGFAIEMPPEGYGGAALPGTQSLLRNWKRWESGDVEPDDFYKPLVAATFGTVTAAFFPVARVDDLD